LTEPVGSLAAYELLSEIGMGGMGIVFRARHRPSRRVVALKVMTGQGLGDPRMAHRFESEVKAMARLRHSNIIRIHDIGRVDGLPFFTMDLARGGTLAQRFHRRRPTPIQATRWLCGIAEGVHHAHQHRVVHRDLKPSNILLDAGGRPKVADFGLAQVECGRSSTFRTGQVVGSPSYMAPEQAEGRWREVGVGSDVYALGSILYEALAGRPPFRAGSVAATLKQVVESSLIPPGAIHAETPRELEVICLKCLEKDPGRRYSSARALADDLRNFLKSPRRVVRRRSSFGLRPSS